MLSQVILASFVAALGFTVSPAHAEDSSLFGKQRCATGCVGSLLVMAFLIAVIACSVVCFITWPAPELKSRQEKRAAAQKRIRERKEAEEEAKAKNEKLDDESL